MSSSSACTCRVCPAHATPEPPAGVGDRAGERAGWAGPAREYLDSVVDWLDGP
jgi:hypothetical protein